ncbi:MAG: tripartite tricarboxylate transporter TctB family protein [Methylobacteriaceae bacterium]|jgi:succinate dehydrogenase hydrophobic anchor subunit|nr:tripartite tricarboxylate transporter TctB family protein [Methylobacteriaceae bacterium]
MEQAAEIPTKKTPYRDRLIELAIAVLLICFAAGVIYVAQGYSDNGMSTDVGPARFPTVYGLVLIALSIALIVQNVTALNRGDVDREAPPISTHRVFLITTGIVLTFAQYWSMPYLGYLTSMFLYLCLLAALMGLRHVLLNPLISAVFTGLIYFCFYTLLNVPLPVGELFE